MSRSQKNVGYDLEEKYFHDLNKKLIENYKTKGSSKALQIRAPAQILVLPQKAQQKRAG